MIQVFNENTLFLLANVRDTMTEMEGVREVFQRAETIDDPGEPEAAGRCRHNPHVTMPESGSQIYKSTLVSSLNQDPNLSHDR